MLSSSVLSRCLALNQHTSFHLPIRNGHWFSKFYKRRKLIRPVSKEVMLKFKDSAKEKLPNPKSVPSLLNSYFDENSPESVKKMYSFEHLGLDVAIEEVIKNRLESLGLSDEPDSTAGTIVQLTVRARMLREQAETKWNYTLEKRLVEMLDRREELLKQLRSEDYSLFLLLLDQLQLSFEHEAPAHVIRNESQFGKRLQETRRRCQLLKQQRLDELEKQLEAKTNEFAQRKAAKLKEAEQKLQTLGLTLSEVLEEVYDDRRTAAEQELLQDRLKWFYGEQIAARNAKAKLEEKKRKNEAKGRK